MTARAILNEWAPPTEQTDPCLFADHLRVNAKRYYPELADGPVTVRSDGGSLRPASVLYEFEIRIGDEAKPVLVKMPLARTTPSATASAHDRPRLVRPTPADAKFLLEHQALALIHEYFGSLGDSRFGTVRPLDVLPALRAVVMERAPGTSLRALWFARPEHPATALEAAAHGAGAWLRAYHGMGGGALAVSRHIRREDHIDFVGELSSFLGDLLRDHAYFQEVASAHAAAAAALPDQLPLGLGHGDFAPRNVLVAPDGRITVLDTLARYRVPIYEDIGYFLAGLRCGWRQVLSLETAIPAARLASWERAFLSGYFVDDPVPVRAIRSYEIQAMLDLWAANAWRHARAAGHGARFTERVKLGLLSRLLRRRIEEAL